METSKKPANTAFKQQRLKAWQPILTPKTAIPTFLLVGLVFVPLGVGLLYTSNQVVEIAVDYTYCHTATSDFAKPNKTVDAENVNRWKYVAADPMNPDKEGDCTVEFVLPTAIESSENINLYYRLTNYYQNHRRYVKSLSSSQLRGAALSPSAIQTDCEPADVLVEGEKSYPIYPCGLIASSLFNDTFSDFMYANGTNITLDRTNIAWASDQKKYLKSTYNITDVRAPPSWNLPNNTYTQQQLDDVATDEDFQVWMRTAGLPNFRKLYAHVREPLEQDVYWITIRTRYPVTEFQGTKGFVLTSVSWLGGKNPFLGIAYMTVGSVCIALGIVFLVMHLKNPRVLGDTKLLSWNKQD